MRILVNLKWSIHVDGTVHGRALPARVSFNQERVAGHKVPETLFVIDPDVQKQVISGRRKSDAGDAFVDYVVVDVNKLLVVGVTSTSNPEGVVVNIESAIVCQGLSTVPMYHTQSVASQSCKTGQHSGR